MYVTNNLKAGRNGRREEERDKGREGMREEGRESGRRKSQGGSEVGSMGDNK